MTTKVNFENYFWSRAALQFASHHHSSALLALAFSLLPPLPHLGSTDQPMVPSLSRGDDSDRNLRYRWDELNRSWAEDSHLLRRGFAA